MTLREAIVAGTRPAAGSPYRLQLCCGFEPLHLISFLKAHASVRLRGATAEQSRPVSVSTGVFGDLAGNIERALGSPDPVAVVVEWADVDPRLGLREGFRPAEGLEASILEEAGARLRRVEQLLAAAAGGRRIVLALPATPLPPWLGGLEGQASSFLLGLRARLAGFAAACAAAGVRVAEPNGSGVGAYELRTHLLNGFPYVNAYADELGATIAGLLHPAVPAKGLITDLDNTLWAGIVGDDGAANVHWSLEKHARLHGLYQQFLASMAAQGVLVGVASKNDPAPVAEALARADLLVPPEALFPVETHWGPKSESIRRIAAAWNIGLDAIVFVDDNPLELEEVKRALPEVDCRHFPATDSNALLELLGQLRRRFARERASDEDRLRAASLRQAAQLAEESRAGSDPEALLAGLEARITVSFAREPFDSRALELLNKTNQFNLNGRRWEESEFRAFLAEPEAVLAVVSYEDRFGALGKIAVAAGRRNGSTLRLASWVMSCRAFSRRIEYSTLRALFDHSGAEEIGLEWQSTARNNPTREALAPLLGELPEAGLVPITRQGFEQACPALYAAVS